MSEQVDPPNDEQLAECSQQGDRDAFAALVDRHWDCVYGWLYRMSRSTHTAEDLTQDTFYKAWAGLASYHSGPGFRAWLFRIARNAWIDHGRREKFTPSELTADVVATRSSTPAETVLEHERSQLLHAAIDDLPGEYREVLLLRCGQSLSFAEIGDVLGAKEDTVRWRVYKARQLLLKKLEAAIGREEMPL